MASSYETSLKLPFLSERIIGSFILWCPIIFAAPSLQACFASIILLPSVTIIRSSHMHPQNGHKASVITAITCPSQSVLSSAKSYRWFLPVQPETPCAQAFPRLWYHDPRPHLAR